MAILNADGNEHEPKNQRHKFGELRVPDDCYIKWGITPEAEYPYTSDGWGTRDGIKQRCEKDKGTAR